MEPISKRHLSEKAKKSKKLIDYEYWKENMGPVWFDISMPFSVTIDIGHKPKLCGPTISDDTAPKFVQDVAEWDYDNDELDKFWTFAWVNTPNTEHPILPIKKIKIYAQSEEDLLKIIMFIG